MLFEASTTGQVAPVGTPTPIDETNASCTIKISGRPWVDPANDVWNGQTITRYNRSRVVDWAAWSQTSITFSAVCLPGLTSSSADPYVCVVVDGALFKAQAIAINFSPIEYTVTGLPAGTHHVQLIDGWQARVSNFDTGADGQISACYVTSVRIPAGQVAPVRKTAALGIVSFGDSTNDGISNEPYSWFGWTAQLRRAAAAAGGLLGYLGTGAGTLCGDGFTAAQCAQMVSDLWAAMGSTNKWFIYMARMNDFRYYDNGGSVETTPTQLATFLGAVLDALTVSDPGYRAVIESPGIPQGTAQIGPNSGSFTRASYFTAIAGLGSGRSQVSFVDGTTWGLNLATDFAETTPNQIHPNQPGQDKIYPPMKAAVGL